MNFYDIDHENELIFTLFLLNDSENGLHIAYLIGSIQTNNRLIYGD
ncbi:MAG: hypothetical protein JXR07_06360 [Reichenbachiella sp.]